MSSIAFNQIMRDTCRKQKITAKELGHVLGASADSIQRLFAGERKVSAKEWITFCVIFEMEPMTGIQLAQSS